MQIREQGEGYLHCLFPLLADPEHFEKRQKIGDPFHYLSQLVMKCPVLTGVMHHREMA
jgi:hypothetical protein